MSDPWADILASNEQGADNLRRARAEHPLEFWWGRDHTNRCLMALDYALSDVRHQFPELAGIEIVSFSRDEITGRLVLTLVDPMDREIFLALCNDLLAATAGVVRDESPVGIRIVIARLQRWRELFRNRRDRLSLRRIIGLAGELFFLRDCLLPRIPAASAVSMWRGPYGDEQDFVAGKTILEIKTQLSTADSALHISSERQLDTLSAPVIIVHQLLGQAAPDTAQAVSLNGLVAGLRRTIASSAPEAIEPFDAGLFAAGYAVLAAYDEPVWLPVHRDMYEVGDAFPRIIPAMLPAGVEAVKYRVRVDTCLPFQIDVDETLGALLDE